ncbi:MAG TPA: hypothetical protein VGP18_01330 [Solirubrobacteraceae bacterium]|jgi:hypothetical protein|nr:hypothetical protein [Solirubrobacteraceae bacterium]
MFSRIRPRLTYANVVATLAMVFAMTGGAYAASKYLITSTKQIKPSVLASLKGKAGANGAAGATGPTGPAGPAGSMGPAGSVGPAGSGTEGKEGKAGANGTSVTSTESANAIEGHCTGTGTTGKGGSKFESASGKTYACNGKEGSPWTAEGTLPSGKTEYGTWAFGEYKAAALGESIETSISFPIPLATNLSTAGCETIEAGHVAATCHVHYIDTVGKEVINLGSLETPHFEEIAPSGCGDGSAGEPAAEPGNLCVYGGGGIKSIMGASDAISVSKVGAFLNFTVGENAHLAGTFAVTAAEE